MVWEMKLPRKDLLRPTEVADYLRISRSTIYGWIEQGKIPAMKICGTIRITREDVEKMIGKK